MKKVLIIEDDSFLKEIEIGKFTKNGLETTTAMTIDEVSSYLQSQKPDIILLDLMLPAIDGFSFLETLKKDDKTSNIPVLVFSNISDENDIKRVLDAGAKEFLIKSNYTLDEVIEKINEHLPPTT